MTAKQRNKNNAVVKNSNPDDVAKRSPKAGERGGPLTAGSDSGSRGSPLAASSSSGSCGSFMAALCYLVLVVAAGFTAFYVQAVREDVRQITGRNEELIHRNAEVAGKIGVVRQEVDSVKEMVAKFDSALSGVRVELDTMGRAQRRAESETQRVEEALQRLQKDILKDLSDGIQEVKQTRQRDFSSLEQAVEERLAELSTSIGDSVAGVAEVQGETQSQLRDLRVRLDGLANPEKFRQELQSLADSMIKFQADSMVLEKTTNSLAEQIGAVGAELQTRNQEVASQSQEIASVRELVQSTIGTLRQSVSAVEVSLQAMSDQAQNMETGLLQAEGSLQTLEKELRGSLDRAERNSEEIEARVKVLEESIHTIQVSGTEQVAKLESSLAKIDFHDSTLATLTKDFENGREKDEQRAQQLQVIAEEMTHCQALGNQAETLKNDLEELKSTVSGLDNAQGELTSGHSSLSQRLDALEQILNTLRERITESQVSNEIRASVSQVQSDLQQLRIAVDNLVAYSVKVEMHEEAIASMQKDLEKTQTTVDVLFKAPVSPEWKE